MIEIIKSSKTDTRLIDGHIDETKLLNATLGHMDNVLDGIMLFTEKLQEAGQQHDFSKIQHFPQFHRALESGDIKNHPWYHIHVTEERHHIKTKVPEDVNLIDILEYISDCVMAGYARTGKLYDISLSNKVLQKAFNNTVEMLKKEIVIKEEEECQTEKSNSEI